MSEQEFRIAKLEPHIISSFSTIAAQLCGSPACGCREMYAHGIKYYMTRDASWKGSITWRNQSYRVSDTCFGITVTMLSIMAVMDKIRADIDTFDDKASFSQSDKEINLLNNAARNAEAYLNSISLYYNALENIVSNGDAQVSSDEARLIKKLVSSLH